MAKCIFCGEGVQTKTHIFRKAWLERLFPSDQPFVHRQVREGESEFDRWWESREFGLAPHAACAPCNNGWMSEVDYEAEALIEPCVLGHAVAFDSRSDQQTLARWMALVALLFDQTQEKPIISQEVRRTFYNRPDPPQGGHAWLAATPATTYEVNGWPRTWRMRSDTGESDGYLCTFRIKHLVAQTYIPPNSESEDVEFVRDNNPQVIAVWPHVGPVVWPPEPIRADQLDIFANQFNL